MGQLVPRQEPNGGEIGARDRIAIFHHIPKSFTDQRPFYRLSRWQVLDETPRNHLRRTSGQAQFGQNEGAQDRERQQMLGFSAYQGNR